MIAVWLILFLGMLYLAGRLYIERESRKWRRNLGEEFGDGRED